MAAPTINDSACGVATGSSVATDAALTISSGDVVYVWFYLADNPSVAASGVSSAGGGTFTEIADSGLTSGFQRLYLYRSTDATVGSHVITATPSGSTANLGVMAVSVSGVDAGTPNGTALFASGSGSGDAVSATISSGTDAIVLDGIGRVQTGDMAATGGNTILDQRNRASTIQVGTSWEAGAASVATGWGVNGQGTVSAWEWLLGALSINGGAGGSAPTVDTNPEGAAAPVGGTAVYAITATGATSYQWQVSTDGGETWTNVTGGSGATTATYTTPAAAAGDNGRQYRCRATNASGTTDSLGAWFFVSGLASAGKARRATLSALWLRTVRRTGSIRGRGVNLLRGMPDNAPNRDSADLMAAWSTFFWEPSPPPPPPAPASFPPINPSVRFAALLRF